MKSHRIKQPLLAHTAGARCLRQGKGKCVHLAELKALICQSPACNMGQVLLLSFLLALAAAACICGHALHVTATMKDMLCFVSLHMLMQVYVAEGGPEEWQLDGIVWKSSNS